MCLEQLKIHCNGVGKVLDDERLEGRVRLRYHVMAAAAPTVILSMEAIVGEDGVIVEELVAGVHEEALVCVAACQGAIFLWSQGWVMHEGLESNLICV